MRRTAIHKTLALASVLLLAACDRPDTTDLSTLTIPGVKPIHYRAHEPVYFLTQNTAIRTHHIATTQDPIPASTS